MLDYHKENHADVTIAAMPVPMEEASRFGIVVADGDGRITEFQEKPPEPKSNLASMGIYIFSWPILKKALMELRDVRDAILENISSLTAMKMDNACLHMNITDIGKM